MPKIVIWIPRDEKHPGHVAIATNAYYVSFWPARCLIKDGKQIGSVADAVLFVLDVHKGRLVFNQDFDKIDEDDPNKEYEDERDPIEYQIDAAKVSNENLNAVIEEFLRYNEINPEDVTLAKGEEKYREFKQLAASLPQEEAKLIKDDQKPVKSLAKTKYSIVTELVSSSKTDNLVPFYKSHQSCVSFAFNLVQMAWLKSHPNPIPIVNYEEAKNVKEFSVLYCGFVSANLVFSGKIPKKLAYKVPWFEKEVVRRYLITGCKVNNQPIISGQLVIEKLIRGYKPMLVSTFVLLLLGYLIPETGYPNVFIFWNFVNVDEVIDDPSILHDFIVPLFIILFAHNFSCGVVLSVVIFQLGGFSYYAIMKYFLSGEFWGSHLLVESLSSVIRIFDDVREHCKRIGREPENLGLSGLVRMLIDSRRAHH